MTRTKSKRDSKRKENDRYLPIWCVCVLVRSIASKLYFANSSHYVFHNSVAARRAKIGGRTNGSFFGCALFPKEKKQKISLISFWECSVCFMSVYCVFTGPPTYRNNVWRAVSYSAWIIFWTNRDAKAVVCRLLGEHNTIQFAKIRCETAESDNNNNANSTTEIFWLCTSKQTHYSHVRGTSEQLFVDSERRMYFLRKNIGRRSLAFSRCNLHPQFGCLSDNRTRSMMSSLNLHVVAECVLLDLRRRRPLIP